MNTKDHKMTHNTHAIFLQTSKNHEVFEVLKFSFFEPIAF
jgi:hypothetical protein